MRWDYPRLLLVGLGLTIGITLVIAASTSSAAFGAYNPEWDGASELRTHASAAGAEPTVLRETGTYEQAGEGDVAVILSPDRSYDDAEATRVQRFMQRGGTVVLAEDYGDNGNQLLAAIGAESRFDGRKVRDERHHYRSPALPVATNMSDDPLVEGVDRLTLNHGTVIHPNGATVIASTSGFAYLDTDGDAELDETEQLGSYPVVTVERFGAGRLIVVSDPSILINAMLERPGNQRFIRGVFDGHDRVLLDYSHGEQLPPLAVARLIAMESPLVQLILGFVVVMVLGAWVRAPGVAARSVDRLRRFTAKLFPGRGPDWLRKAPSHDPPAASTDALVNYLEQRHPEWSRERIERVVEATRSRDD